MKINDLDLYSVIVGGEDSTPQEALLTRLSTDSGLEGWGESRLPWRVAELMPRREALLAVLAGRSIYDIEELQSLEALGPPALRAAVEIAFWDLLGRALRQPVCNLLGGYYRRWIPVSKRISGLQCDRIAQVARELVEQGFHTLTIVSSGSLDSDIEMVSAIREMVGDRVQLRFDGMELYDMEAARDLTAGLEYLGLQFCVDPLKVRDLHTLASLARQTSVPLAAWRSIRSPADVLTTGRCNAASFVMVDLEQVGGLTLARACIAVAAAAGLTPLLASRPSLGVSAAAMLHLAAATAALSTANEISISQSSNLYIPESADILEGMIAAPQTLGLGVRPERAKIEGFQAG